MGVNSAAMYIFVPIVIFSPQEFWMDFHWREKPAVTVYQPVHPTLGERNFPAARIHNHSSSHLSANGICYCPVRRATAKGGRNLVFNAQTTMGPVCTHHHDPVLSHCFP